MKTIGFVGLGLMGSAMAQRLLESGYILRVFNRTKEKAEPLLKAGAVWADSPAEAASGDLVFTMLSTPDVLREVARREDGILAGLSESAVHVDCGTVSPAVTGELAALYKQQRRGFLHCPVLGSVPQALEGSLLIMAGGDRKTFDDSVEVLRVLGKKIWMFDSVEQAAHAKLLCNSFIAGMIVTLTQAIVFARKASVDPKVLLEIVENSALNSPMYQTKGKNILAGNFEARFFVEHLLKDVDLMLEAAGIQNVDLPVVKTVRDLLVRTVREGYGKDDYSSVIKVLEKI